MIRIAIFGSECTGKTTLAQRLAIHYNTLWVHEYSREYCLIKPELDITDVIPIMQGQIALEAKAAAAAAQAYKPLIICDTIPLSSIVYSQYYNGNVPEQAEQYLTFHYHAYLLTNIDIPWEDDDVRGENINRPLMHQLFEQSLVQRGIPYSLLTGNYAQRFILATKIIDTLLST